jgi:hypothetical protein
MTVMAAMRAMSGMGGGNGWPMMGSGMMGMPGMGMGMGSMGMGSMGMGSMGMGSMGMGMAAGLQAKAKARGNYRCSLCGGLKAGHVCKGVTKGEGKKMPHCKNPEAVQTIEQAVDIAEKQTWRKDMETQCDLSITAMQIPTEVLTEIDALSEQVDGAAADIAPQI